MKESKLRISAGALPQGTPSRRRPHLRPLRRALSRLGRGFDAGEAPGYDPSNTGPGGPSSVRFHDYLQKELKYTSSDTYYRHAVPASSKPGTSSITPAASRPSSQLPDTAVDLADAMRKNPKLRVFSANGYFDLATPFFATEYDLSHMMLPPSLVGNIEFGYYPSGHMVYLNVDALKQMKADLDRFYAEATAK